MAEQPLRSIPLFSFIEPHEEADLVRLMRPVALDSGQVLFREQTPGDSMWVLGKAAQVSISATPPGGKRPVVIATALEGETVGEMALIDDAPRSGTAVVMQPGQAHQIAASDFRALREAFKPLAFKILRQICRQLCSRLRATSERIAPSTPAGGSANSPSSAGRRASETELDEFPPFRALPQIVKLALSQKLLRVQAESGQILFAEGEEGDAAYFLSRGEVSVSRNRQPLATLGPGAMVGLIAVIDGGRRSATCVAKGPASLLRLSRSDFESLFNAGNRFAFQIVDLSSRQLVSHLRKANELLPGHRNQPATLSLPTRPFAQGPELNAEVVSLELEMELSPGESASH